LIAFPQVCFTLPLSIESVFGEISNMMVPTVIMFDQLKMKGHAWVFEMVICGNFMFASNNQLLGKQP
jgi:hypothetical protein